MSSTATAEKPHAVCIPFPAQGHITPMLKLAKLLHLQGFHITFVNTEYNHNRLLKSQVSLEGLNDFRFVTIPDGLPPSDQEGLQDLPLLCTSITNNFTSYLRDLVNKIKPDTPPVSCIVSDGVMSFTLDVAEELGVPEVLFWTLSACGFMGYLHYQQLVERGLFPLQDESALTNGFLDTPVDWVPGMEHMRLRDFPSFAHALNPDDILFNYCNREAQRTRMASAIILNTFDLLEQPILDAMAPMLPPVYTVGPLSLLFRHMPKSTLTQSGSNLYKEETDCLQWLEGRKPRSVVYVNFGSTTTMSNNQLIEFAWGLAHSGYDFLWVIRPDLVKGDSAVLPPEFVKEVGEKCLLAKWCPQEELLLHPALGGFLTHSGWNSTLESICGGVPMICWPFFAEQQVNCRYATTKWGVGMEIDGSVRRKELEVLIRELMDGEKGGGLRRKAMEWKECAVEATELGGSSFVNMEKLVKDVLLRSRD